MVSHEACAFRLAQELRCSCIYVNCITPSVAYNPTSPLTPTPLAVLLVNWNFFLSFLLLPNPPPPPFFSLHPTIPCILLSLALQTKIELKDVLLRRWGGRGVLGGGGRRNCQVAEFYSFLFRFTYCPALQNGFDNHELFVCYCSHSCHFWFRFVLLCKKIPSSQLKIRHPRRNWVPLAANWFFFVL